MNSWMNKWHWRCLSAMGGGVSIGAVVALISLPVNMIPTLAAGLMMGLLMALSEPTAEA